MKIKLERKATPIDVAKWRICITIKGKDHYYILPWQSNKRKPTDNKL